jgi:cytochrome c556
MARILFRAVMTVACVGVLAAVAAAQDGKEAVIKARIDFMNDQQHAVNAINAFAKGQGDRQAAVAGAGKLLVLATEMGTKFDALFPPGTSTAEFPGKTHAKPELWQHLDEARAAPAKLHEAELKLAEVVKTGDAQTVGKAMSAVYRGSCNALCHNDFRAPLKRP